MDFDSLINIVDDCNYIILEEEHETIFFNCIVWVKVNKSIWQGKLIQIPFSDRKEDIKIL